MKIESIMKNKFNKELLPLKLLLFTFYGATACILPYLTVHMRQIGITVEETAIIYAILPIVGFLGPPTAGFMADRLGRYRPVLVACLVAMTVIHTLLLAIPPVTSVEASVRVDSGCDDVGTNFVKIGRCLPGASCPTAFTLARLNFSSDRCQASCLISSASSLASSGMDNRTSCSISDDSDVGCSNISDAVVDSFSDLRLFSEDVDSCQYRVRLTNRSNCPSTDVDGNCVDATCSLLSPINGTLNICTEYVGDHLLTFSTYFLLRVVGGVFMSTAFTLMDATCFATINKCEGDYARQKLWSVLASGIFSPITGFLIDHVSTRTQGYADYSPAFYLFDALMICTILLSLRITVELDNSSQKMFQNLKLLLKKMEVVAFLLMIFVLGSLWGFLETFLFWYMLDLHSPKYLLGLTVTVGAGVSIPVMFCAGKILKKTGNIPLLIGAFAFYAVRMVGYSFIINPWWSLVFESFEVLTINLMWVAAATYGNSIAPPGLLATMQGTMGGIHYGIGRGAGSFFGGLLLQHFGARRTFRIMGLTSTVACFCTLIYYFSYFRRSKKVVDYGEGNDCSSNCVSIKNREDSQLQQMLKSEEKDQESVF